MSTNFYETDRALSEYLLFHYGSREEVLPYDFGPSTALHFPVRCVTECLDVRRLPAQARALDLGCAVGRSTFELARHCEQVTGIDHSERFIAAAHHLQQHGYLDFAYPEEGDLVVSATARVPTDVDRRRIAFERGDALELRSDLGSFDVVLMANLLDRLPAPQRCLKRLPALVKPRGQLIITSPCTWLAEYTPKKNWLGGFERDGKPVQTFDTLHKILSPNFDLSFRKDLPFLIREHARKFQWSVAEATGWSRK